MPEIIAVLPKVKDALKTDMLDTIKKNMPLTTAIQYGFRCQFKQFSLLQLGGPHRQLVTYSLLRNLLLGHGRY